MKKYLSEIIPNIQKFSQRLDNVALLKKHQWVVINDSLQTKEVFIFQSSKELLISRNGKVERASWKCLDKNSILIETYNGTFLHRHGFFDDNVLALKLDGSAEFSLMIDEDNYSEGINTKEKIAEYLYVKYLSSRELMEASNEDNTALPVPETTDIEYGLSKHKIKEGLFVMEYKRDQNGLEIRSVKLNGKIAPDGKYKLGFMHYVHIENGKYMRNSIF